MWVHPQVFYLLILLVPVPDGSIPALRPAFAVRVRVIPRVWVWVAYLRAAGLPVLLPSSKASVTGSSAEHVEAKKINSESCEQVNVAPVELVKAN